VQEGKSPDRAYPLYAGTILHSEYLNRFSTTSSGKVFFGPSTFRSLREFFTGRARYEKRSSTVKGLLLGVYFVAEGPMGRNTFEKLKQKRCQSYQSGSFVAYLQMHRLKDEKTNWPMVICIMIVIGCKGHKCKSTQAAPCAYK
jgi:dihydrofolate reductase